MKILFVCLGNICRSPMAEGFLRAQAPDFYHIDSAATSNWNMGQAPHRGTQKVLRDHGIAYYMMHARQISPKDFYDYDFIIGMDRSNVDDLLSFAPEDTHSKIHLFMAQVAGKETMDIPDPWYTGNFNETEQLVMEGTQAWLAFLLKQPIKK